MTDDDTSVFGELFDDETRRSVLKKGAMATAGAGLASSATGSAAAQDNGTDGGNDGGVLGGDQTWQKAIMPVSQFQPNSRFVITSPVVRWSPNVAAIRDDVWSDYNTRTIRYLNTNENVLFWQAHEAQVPNYNKDAGYVVDAEGDTGPNNTPQPEVFRMHPEYSPLGDTGFLTVQFTPVGEDEEQTWLENNDWWYAQDDDPVTPDDVNSTFSDMNV
ncbi:MAG: hypothetical protein ABEJ31_04480 [Haloarculaceae archaeon]